MLVRCRNRAEVGFYQPETRLWDPETGWYDVETGYYTDETGWFGSKLLKKVGKAVSSVAKTVAKVPGISTALAPVRLARDIARGKNVVASIKKQGAAVVADTRKALPVAASIVSVIPGAGTAVGAGLSAVSAVSQGKSLAQIGQAAALGAIPGGQLARSALRAGIGVARGQNVLKTVGREGLAYARQNLPGGELAQRALNVGIAAAQGQNVARAAGREALSYARQNIPVPSLPANVQNVVSSVTSNVRKAVPMNLSRPNFGMPASISPENVARIRQVSVGLRRPNMRAQIQPTMQRKAGFRPLAMNTRSWLVKGLPHMRGEVSGLSETGAQWIVESGDTGSKIALKLTGSAGRWTELRAVNPTVMGRGAKLVAKYGFPIYVGDKVNLPASWIKVTAQTPAQAAPATATAATPPPVVMPAGDIAAQGQARTILTAWGKTDGKNAAGVSDYGATSEILATSWTARDVLMGSSFATWWRTNGGPPAVADGNWSDDLAKALNAWAEQKAAQVSNTAIAAGGVVVPSTAAPASPAAAPTAVGTPAPSPWAITVTPAQFPSTVAAPTAATPAAQASTAPQAAPGMTDSQKWGFGSIAAGGVLTLFIRLLTA